MDQPTEIPRHCERCGKPLGDRGLDRPVRIEDALWSPLITHARCAYNAEYGNGSVFEIDDLSRCVHGGAVEASGS